MASFLFNTIIDPLRGVTTDVARSATSVDNTRTTISGGTVEIQNFGGIPGCEVYHCTGSQAFTGDAVHSVIRFNGDLNTLRVRGMSLWDTGSHIFRPSKLNHIYTFQIAGILSASTGTPVLHIDFDLGGRIPTGSASHHTNPSIHRVGHDFNVVKGTSFDHSHFQLSCLLFVDADVIASGVQFYGAIDGNQTVTLKSASIFIKEG